MARLLIEAILNGAETAALEILQNGKYGCIDSQTARRDGTALFICCNKGYVELANRLIEKGASISSRNKSLATPLHAAVDNGHLDIVNLLIHKEADLNAQTHRGDTPLHLAAFRGFQAITQSLVEAGADIGMLNSNNITPLNEAISNQHVQLANYLAAVHNLRHPKESSQSLEDAMIQLDPPSIPKPTELSSQQRHYHQKQQQQQFLTTQKQIQPPQQQQQQLNELTCGNTTSHPVTLVSPTRSNSTPRPKISLSCSIEQDYNDLAVIKLDPPSDESRCLGLPRHHYSANQRQEVKRRVSDTTDHTPNFNATPCQRKTSWTPRVIRSPPPIPVSTALTPQASSGSLQPTLFQNFSRRPSAGSTGSCFSDISGGTGSDTSSLLSTGSEASSMGNEVRREEMDLQDLHIPGVCNGFVGDRSKDSLNMSQIRGVRFPPPSPSSCQFRRGSITSPQPSFSEFSDLYDSSLFSFGSLRSGPPSSLASGSSLMSVDSVPSDFSRRSSSSDAPRACSPPPSLARATSVHHYYNGAETLLRGDVKARPSFNKSISAENKPVYRPELRALANGQSNMLSINDLSSTNSSSSSYSLMGKPASSMTCVNIPPS